MVGRLTKSERERVCSLWKFFCLGIKSEKNTRVKKIRKKTASVGKEKKMSNLRLQKRLSASIMKCGRNKVWIDPNEIGDIQSSTTRASIRKLIRDGFIIKKPQKIHSRYRARQRAVEKKKGRHLGFGSRKGTKNARNPVQVLWRRKQRAFRLVLKRYRESGRIDRRMYDDCTNLSSVVFFLIAPERESEYHCDIAYCCDHLRYHRMYLRAKGNTFKNRRNLVDHIDADLREKRRNAVLLAEYKAKREIAVQRQQQREEKRKAQAEELARLAEKAEEMVIAAKEAKKKKEADSKKSKPTKATKGAAKGADKPAAGMLVCSMDLLVCADEKCLCLSVCLFVAWVMRRETERLWRQTKTPKKEGRRRSQEVNCSVYVLCGSLIAILLCSFVCFTLSEYSVDLFEIL